MSKNKKTKKQKNKKKKKKKKKIKKKIKNKKKKTKKKKKKKPTFQNLLSLKMRQKQQFRHDKNAKFILKFRPKFTKTKQ